MVGRSDADKPESQKSQDALKQHRNQKKAAALTAYQANLPRCVFCAAVLPFTKRGYKFCNHSCAARFNNVGITRNPRKVERRTHCLRCGQSIQAAGKIYCSQKCSHAHRMERFAEKLLSGTEVMPSGSLPAIRRCLIRLHGEQCEECGWNKQNPVTSRVPLEVHHVDGNFENNCIGNVQLLCPNCHSLTPTFRNLNKGKGRTYRRNVPG